MTADDILLYIFQSYQQVEVNPPTNFSWKIIYVYCIFPILLVSIDTISCLVASPHGSNIFILRWYSNICIVRCYLKVIISKQYKDLRNTSRVSDSHEEKSTCKGITPIFSSWGGARTQYIQRTGEQWWKHFCENNSWLRSSFFPIWLKDNRAYCNGGLDPLYSPKKMEGLRTTMLNNNRRGDL